MSFETEVREAMVSTAREIRANVTAGEKAAMAWDKAAREGTLGRPPERTIAEMDAILEKSRRLQGLMTAEERRNVRNAEKLLKAYKGEMVEQRKRNMEPKKFPWHETHGRDERRNYYQPDTLEQMGFRRTLP